MNTSNSSPRLSTLVFSGPAAGSPALRAKRGFTRSVVAVLVGLTMLGASELASARIKCWTNKDGLRECGNSVPPEYAQKKHRVINEKGMVVEEQDRAKTEEELAAERLAKEEKERQVAEEKLRAEEAKKAVARRAAHDRVLLNTYADEQELLYTRDNRISAVESRIEHTQQVIAKLEKDLEAYEKRAATTERGGKKASDEDLARVEDVHSRISDQWDFIRTLEAEKAEFQAQFKADLARYRELTAKAN